MGTQRVAIDWDGLERALTSRSRESEAFLDTRTGDIIWVTHPRAARLARVTRRSRSDDPT